MSTFQFLDIQKSNGIATISLNNSKKANCINGKMWFEIGDAFSELDKDDSVRVCVLKGNGKHFSSGIDLKFIQNIMEETSKFQTESEQQKHLEEVIKKMQDSFTAVASCKKPVIASIHGICVGGAVDLICACDLRYSTAKAAFSILETKLGIVADMGTLQRARFILGEGRFKELAYTSKIILGIKAKQYGLVNNYFLTKSKLEKEVYKIAKDMAELPGYALQNTKKTINYSREHKVQEGLDYIAKLNSTLLRSDEAVEFFKKMFKEFSAK